jgi:WD40 repeat protein
MKKGLEFTELM